MGLTGWTVAWTALAKLPLDRLNVRWRRAVIHCVLALSVLVSLTGAFLLRFDLTIPETELRNVALGLLIFLPVKLVIFCAMRLHRGWWVSFGVSDVGRILFTLSVASVLAAVITMLVVGRSFPRSVYVLEFVLNVGTLAATRVLLRIYQELPRDRESAHPPRAVLIYGAGWAGAALLRDLRANPSMGLRVVGFIDDSPAKRNETLMGVPVLGQGREVIEVVRALKDRGLHVEEVLIAMPSASGRQMREALANCRAAGIPCKTLPGIGDLLVNKGLSVQIRDVSMEDLLGRQPVALDEAGIRTSLMSRSVLVTGGAGSIGSELCRQIARFSPGLLVVLDRAESDLFYIDLELRSKYPSLKIVAEVADIRDAAKLNEIIQRYRVECIFHAAAYKHVPLMEAQPVEAARNNILGTWNVARAAAAHGVLRFVMISTDKAVNPTSIMGLTKRISELIVSSFPVPAAPGHGTRFVSVRFGNVLASNGSVVNVFKRQIAAGGPVTVTHPEVRRYFMTVREAVQLVLQASTMGAGSEIFVLDMGEPVKIVDLARNMIRMAGYLPDEEVEIRYVGLRPGEKLFEELAVESEDVVPTRHDKIKIFRAAAARQHAVEPWIAELGSLTAARDESGTLAHMAGLVQEYTTSARWRETLLRRAEKAAGVGAA